MIMNKIRIAKMAKKHNLKKTGYVSFEFYKEHPGEIMPAAINTKIQGVSTVCLILTALRAMEVAYDSCKKANPEAADGPLSTTFLHLAGTADAMVDAMEALREAAQECKTKKQQGGKGKK